jgi:hypothetical protein
MRVSIERESTIDGLLLLLDVIHVSADGKGHSELRLLTILRSTTSNHHYVRSMQEIPRKYHMIPNLTRYHDTTPQSFKFTSL